MDKTPSKLLSRRRVFAGAGTVGALAAAAAVLPLAESAAPQVSKRDALKDDAHGRYQETAHVQQYYRTAKV